MNRISVGISAVNNSRRGWVAALLSFAMPGLGHLYIGRPIWAAAFIAIPLVELTAIPTAQRPLTRSGAVILVFCAVMALFCIVDAWRQAKQQHDYTLRIYNRWWVYTVVFLILTAVSITCTGGSILPFRSKQFHVQANSMMPTVIAGDYVMADTYLPALTQIKRGDVVLFEYDGSTFIKRIVGLPGDRLSLSNDILSINGQALVQQPVTSWSEVGIAPEDAQGASLYREHWPDYGDVILLRRGSNGPFTIIPPMTVPDGNVFVMGDSRDNSKDSRAFGPVPVGLIVGRASFITWSAHISRLGKLLN